MSKRKSQKQNKNKVSTEESHPSVIKREFSKIHFTLSIIGILIIGYIAYSNTLKVPFYFDDYDSIVDNPLIKNIDNYLKIPAFANFNDRFISYLTIALNYHFHQFEVFGYHMVNIVIHLINTLLVILLSIFTLSTPVMKDKFDINNRRVFSLFVGLIFIVHPIQIQAVTYIIQRMSSLSALFYLLTLLLYVKGRMVTLDTDKRSIKKIFFASFFFITSLIGLILGIWSKQTVASFPLAVVIYEIIFLREKNNKINLKIILSVLFFYALLVAYYVINYGLPIETDEISRSEYLFTQLEVMVIYIRYLFLPFGQNIDHDHQIVNSLFNFSTLASFFFLIALLGIAIMFIKRVPIVSFSIFWFFLSLSIESSIIPIRDLMVEHRLYLPVFGFALSVVFLLHEYIKNIKYRYLIFSLIALSLSISTYMRNNLWNNPVEMWSDAIKKSPDKVRPYFARGSVFLHSGQFDNCILDMQKVIMIDKYYFKAYDNIGFAYQEKKDFQRALKYHNEALRINPNFASAYNNRGVCYLYMGNWDLASQDFQKAISLNQYYTDAFFNLGYIYFYKKEYQNSIDNLNKALYLNPSYNEIYSLLAANYIYLQKNELAKNTIAFMKLSGINIPNSLSELMKKNNLD
jgi:tetratricopeptide (TPR) repeat protein